MRGRMYTDPQKRYAFVVPDGWQLQQTQVPTISVQFVADRLRGNVNLVAEDAPNIALEQYVTATLTNIKKSFPDFVLDPKGVQPTHLGGNPAQQYEFSGVQQQTRIHVMQVVTINAHTAYILTFTVQVDDADAFAEQAKAILTTFAFREQP